MLIQKIFIVFKKFYDILKNVENRLKSLILIIVVEQWLLNLMFLLKNEIKSRNSL